MKKLLKLILIALIGVLLLFSIYFLYVIIDYHRLPDNISIEAKGVTDARIPVGQTVKIITYNIGYGSYPPDYSFFMEGGNESVARSKENVIENINGSIKLLKKYDPDIILLQEVDVKGTRSKRVNEYNMFCTAFVDYNGLYAQNYDSSYLFYPLIKPIGKNKSGIALFSKYSIDLTLRKSLPISKKMSKLLDLDRCYTLSEIPVENGKTLCLYNLHLTAYGGSGEIREQQIKQLASSMKEQQKNGNYIICGGDFNSDVPRDSFMRLNPTAKEIPQWAKNLLVEFLPEGITVRDAYSNDAFTPTSRSLSRPYQEGVSEIMIIDGFLASDNVKTIHVENINNKFLYSDHNPVYMELILKDALEAE